MTGPNIELVAQALRAGARDCTARADVEVLDELADGIEQGRYGIALVAGPVDDSKCDDIGDAELVRNCLRDAAIRAAAGGHLKCAQRARDIATSLEAATVDELFGQTRGQIEQAWREKETSHPYRRTIGNAGVELFPRGAEPVSELATWLRESGALYAINRAVLHTLGYALGVETVTTGEHAGKVQSLALVRTADPEGITFDELSREQGRGRFVDRELASVLTALRELDAELDAELKQRGKWSEPHTLAAKVGGDRETVDAAVVQVLVEHSAIDAGPAIGRGIIANELGLTRAQLSASLLRLTSNGTVVEQAIDGETAYRVATSSHTVDTGTTP